MLTCGRADVRKYCHGRGKSSNQRFENARQRSEKSSFLSLSAFQVFSMSAFQLLSSHFLEEALGDVGPGFV